MLNTQKFSNMYRAQWLSFIRDCFINDTNIKGKVLVVLNT